MRRALGLLLAVLVAFAAVVGLLLFLQARDRSTLDRSGDATPNPGTTVVSPAPARRAAVRRDGVALTEDQVRTAVLAGNVVLVYGAAADAGPLRAVQDDVAGPFDPDLAKVGEAVILARRPGTGGVVAMALGHELRVASADDPRLRDFAGAYVGKGPAG